MLEQAIFNEITGDATLAAKIEDSGIYHCYPLFVPQGVLPNRAITYTEIDQSLVYPLLRTSLFQFNCLAESFADAIDLADDLDRIFNDIREVSLGGVQAVKYIKFQGRSTLYNAEANLHQVVVEFLFKY